MRKLIATAACAALSLCLFGCSGGAVDSDDYKRLEAEGVAINIPNEWEITSLGDGGRLFEALTVNDMSMAQPSDGSCTFLVGVLDDGITAEDVEGTLRAYADDASYGRQTVNGTDCIVIDADHMGMSMIMPADSEGPVPFAAAATETGPSEEASQGFSTGLQTVRFE